MFRDLKDGTSAMPEGDFDLCIVGAGPAGITLARAFIGTALRVLLIESGGIEPESSVQALNAGSVTGLPYYPPVSTRLRQFGGTTNHWAGQSLPMDPHDFEPRPWVPDSGWPIPYSELARYLEPAQDICRLGRSPFSADHWLGPADTPFRDGSFVPTVLRYPTPVSRFGDIYRDELRP